MRTTRVGLIAACLSIAGVAGVAGAADAAARPPPSRPTVHWDTCERRLTQTRCGHIEVALDPSDASLGKIAIGFELYPRKDTALPSLGTIVAMEGGPGYATTSSRAGYLDLYRPLRDRRDVLLMDARGTGLSQPIDCVPLQSYLGNRIARIGLCGQQLGAASDVYGTAFVADDLAHVLDALGIDKIDLYGDSWGTFFSQTFAIRHPDRVRTLVLDSSYPVVQHDPWYRAANAEIVDAFRLACERSPACASLGGDPVARIEALDDALRAHPLHGTTTGSDGKPREITVDPPTIATIAADAGYDPPVYRELDGAARAYLDPVDPDPAPLLRLVSENEVPGGAGVPRQSSEGEYDANVCNDYPQLWDIMAPIADRPAQYAASLAYLHATDPNAFFPFTISDWTHSDWTEYRWCIQWPVPSNYVFPVARPVQYPNVPTLVLSGDLDSVTWPSGGRTVAKEFPDSTFVSVANLTHVTAVSDFGRCTSAIVVRFVATRSAGDTSCAAKYSEVRMVEQFPRARRRGARAAGHVRALVHRRPEVGDGRVEHGRRRVPALVQLVHRSWVRSARWFVHVRQRRLFGDSDRAVPYEGAAVDRRRLGERDDDVGPGQRSDRRDRLGERARRRVGHAAREVEQLRPARDRNRAGRDRRTPARPLAARLVTRDSRP